MVIVSRRTPFQIFRPVIGFDFVFVVDLWQPVRIRNKCQSNQAMYANTTAGQIDNAITIGITNRAQHLSVYRTFHAARVAYLIPGESGRIFPFFHT